MERTPLTYLKTGKQLHYQAYGHPVVILDLKHIPATNTLVALCCIISWNPKPPKTITIRPRCRSSPSHPYAYRSDGSSTLYTRYATAQEHVINIANAQATVTAYIASLRAHLDQGAIPTRTQLFDMCNKLDKVLMDPKGGFVADKAAKGEIEGMAEIEKVLDVVSNRYPEMVALMRSHINMGSDFGGAVRFKNMEEEAAKRINQKVRDRDNNAGVDTE